MDETGDTGNSSDGIGDNLHFPGIEEAERSASMGDMMEDRDQMELDLNDNYKFDKLKINEAIESPALSSQNSANATRSDSNSDPSAVIFSTERASDLLLAVTLVAEPTRSEIIDLAQSAMDELAKIAVVGEPLWLLQKESKYETLNDIEYLKEFGHIEATLREIMKMVEVGDPGYLLSFDLSRVESKLSLLQKPASIEALQVEASRDIAYVNMDPINIVELLMDLGQWTGAFHKIVSTAVVLGTLCNGMKGSYDRKLQMMGAEFHLPTPLVATRKCYFARYCKQLSHDEWGVVDVSLDKLFSNPSSNIRRKPSGCLIKKMPLGQSKVTWVEHVEADYRGLNVNFKPLVTSGFAFSATRCITCLLRHCEKCETLKATTTYTVDGVLMPRAGRSLLKLAERMMRSFCDEINASTEKQWMELPISDSKNVRFRIKNNVDEPGKPPDSMVVFTTSISRPTSPSPLFHFLRDENSRNKWDLLSRGLFIREIAFIDTGKDPGNRVSIMQVKSAPDKIDIFYLQESYTDSTGCYVIYAPMDDLAISAVLNGGNPDHVAILPSGFAILPGEMPKGDEQLSGGSLLTIAFYIVDGASDRRCIPLESVKTIQKIITETIISIKAAMIAV